MIRNTLYLAAASLPLTFFACSANESSNQSTVDQDSGIVGNDGGKRDGAISKDDGGQTVDDGGGRDGGSVQGTPIQSGELSIEGLTSDDNIVYVRVDAVAQKLGLEVSPIAGGSPTVLAADFQDSDQVLVDGATVAIWTNVDAMTGLGKLQVWTKANGLKDVLASGAAAGAFAGSADGTRMAYVKSDTTFQLVVGNTDMVAGPTTIEANINLDDTVTDCTPSFYFVAQNLFSATCGGAFNTAAIRRTTVAGVSNILASGVTTSFSVNSAGDKLFSVQPPSATPATSGRARIHTIGAQGAATDQNVDTGVDVGVISKDGTLAVYQKGAALRKATIGATITPADLVATGVRGLIGISPDDKFTIWYKNAPDTANQQVPRIDLQLSGTAAAAAPTQVAASMASFESFTSSSSHVIYQAEVPAADFFAKVKAHPVAGGGADKELSAKGAITSSIEGTSQVVIIENLRKVGTVNVVDLKLADAEGAASASTLLTAIDPLYLVSGKKVYFTTPGQGLFVKSIP